MKKLLLLLLFVPLIGLFSQQNVEIDLSPKEYKKIKKKLDLKIINRGYDGSGKVWVEADQMGDGPISSTRVYAVKYWNDALFEIGLPTGEIIEQTYNSNVIDADWIIQIAGNYGSPNAFSGKILDFNNNSDVVLTFSTKEKIVMQSYRPGTKRGQEFKAYVKVVMNEILKTIK
tara:strand:- start:205 stop:723 length:519 start_codon:yes stop_codon:yes gene_type:complete